MTYKIEFSKKDVAEIKAILSIFSDLKNSQYKGMFTWPDNITLEISDSPENEQILDDVEALIKILSDDNIEYLIYTPCIECKGEGTYEIFNCKDMSNECCGGCYDQYPCEICEGEGQEMITSNFSYTKN